MHTTWRASIHNLLLLLVASTYPPLCTTQDFSSSNNNNDNGIIQPSTKYANTTAQAILSSSDFVRLTISSPSSNATSQTEDNKNFLERLRDIQCRHHGRPTTVASCRPVLDYFKTSAFPKFSRRQLFRVGPPGTPLSIPKLPRSPYSPLEPPFEIALSGGDCIIYVDVRAVETRTEGVEGWFSWKAVHRVATRIIARCQEEEGYGFGGFAGIGDPEHDAWDNGWFVMAVGKPAGYPGPPGGYPDESLGEEWETYGGGNGTVEVVAV